MASNETLDGLLFRATNPSNKLEDVNTIKQFCDAVNSNLGGDAPALACKLLAHKIQSPQEREALQALAVLEACVKSCGPSFHTEVGKFKFLNEMIKLVSPKYLAPRTPEHIKKKVIELLYVWSTKELKEETKITEAYDMLKKQGIITEDPKYVGDAVFASALPPRKSAPLNSEQTQKLRTLLQSKNPDDLQLANKIIKGMVQEDERKMDVLTKRATELTMVNNNAKLLSEMLDHYDKNNCGVEEKQLLEELFQSCEKMQPKLFKLAGDAEDNDNEGLAKILQANDEINKVIERYKQVILHGKPDLMKSAPGAECNSIQDQLLDLNVGPSKISKESKTPLIDEDLLGLTMEKESKPKIIPEETKKVDSIPIPDLLNDDNDSSPLESLTMLPLSSLGAAHPGLGIQDFKTDEKTSRQKGLEELDLLGESLLKQHLPEKRSPQFEKKKSEKLSLNVLQQKQKQKDLTTVELLPDVTTSPEVVHESSKEKAKEKLTPSPSSSAIVELPRSPILESEKVQLNVELSNASALPITPATESTTKSACHQKINGNSNHVPSEQAEKDVKLADLNVPLSSIKPGHIPPLTLQESDDGISIVLHFGQDKPREHVTAIVVTVINKLSEAIADYELKAVVPKGCKIKLQNPSTTSLPAHNPFVPPSAITQVMLIANPKNSKVSLKYIVSYTIDDEPQTEMGQIEQLPI